MKNYGAKLQPIPGHVIQTHQSRGPGLAAVMAVGSSIIIFFLTKCCGKKRLHYRGSCFCFVRTGGKFRGGKNEKAIGRHVRCVGGGLAHPGPVLRTNKRASLDRFFPPLGALGDVMTISIR